MKPRTMLLVIGILLSIASKWLQFQYGSLWGDILILPVAVSFVLAILLSIPQYQTFLKDGTLRRPTKMLAAYVCATVLSFQLFTMLTFGQGQSWGFLFLIVVLLFAGLSLFQWRSLTR